MLARLLSRSRSEERSTINLSQYAAMWNDTLGVTYSPMPVTVQRAMTHAASSACIDVLASSLSQTPVDVVVKRGAARLPVSGNVPLTECFGSDVWRYQLGDSMLTDGNGFGVVLATDRLSRPIAIELLDPAVVQNRRVVNGVPTASVGTETMQLFPHGDLWHVPGKFIRAGSPFAESPVTRAAATIGAALAAREFGSRFHGDGGHPGGLITSDEQLTPDQAQTIKRAFLNAVNGTREPAVLGSGLTYQPIMVDPNDSQFIDLMRFCIEEACRFWRVPPSMVYAATSGQNVTYANVSQADLHYLKHSVEWLFVRLENAWSRLLTRPQEVRFNRNAFLRADAETRFAIYDQRLKNGTMSVNQVLALEDEEPVSDPAYDVTGVPGDRLKANVESVGALVRAGFDPAEALEALGLPPIKHTGLIPVTVTEPEPAAAPAPTAPKDE